MFAIREPDQGVVKRISNADTKFFDPELEHVSKMASRPDLARQGRMERDPALGSKTQATAMRLRLGAGGLVARVATSARRWL
jgi:hypothetical protein